MLSHSYFLLVCIYFYSNSTCQRECYQEFGHLKVVQKKREISNGIIELMLRQKAMQYSKKRGALMARRTVFRSWLCHWQTMYPWASHLTYVTFSFLSVKMQVVNKMFSKSKILPFWFSTVWVTANPMQL